MKSASLLYLVRPQSPAAALVASCALACLLLLAGCGRDSDARSATAAGSGDEFALSSECPPDFAPDDAGLCIFQDPYAGFEPPWEIANIFKALPPLPGPFTPQQIDLGRLLFFDPILSADQDVSCAHCHHPDDGLADGHGRSIGRGGSGAGRERSGERVLARGAPSLWNIGFATRLFVDGRALDL